MLTAPDELGNYTFADAMVRGWGIVVNCRTCSRIVTLNDAELLRRFGKVAFQPMRGMKGKAHCEQCGNREPLIYPYNAGVSINWADKGKAVSDEKARIKGRMEELQEWARIAPEDRAPPPPPAANDYAAAKKR